jgi:hypothetical protein
MSPHLDGARRELETVFATARRHASTLAIALRVEDERIASQAGGRLRRALLCATTTMAAVATRDPMSYAVLAAGFRASTQDMYDLLAAAPSLPQDTERARSCAWGADLLRPTDELEPTPDIVGLETAGRDLQMVEFFGLHVARSRFMASLRGTWFVESLVETSDFAYGDLRETLWQRTRVRRCHFREAELGDARFEDALFIDCDLRSANLGDSADHGPAAGVTFVRCDLRDTTWGGRDLSSVHLIDCTIGDADAGRDAGVCSVGGADPRARAARLEVLS